MYNVAREAESGPSILEHLETYRDPSTFENVNSCDAATQQNINGNSSQNQNNASYSFNDKQQSDTHLNHDAVKVHKIDICLATETSTETAKCQTCVTVHTLNTTRKQLRLQT